MAEKENNKSEIALREEAVLEYWRQNNIFSKTLSKSKGKKEFIFYEGPPTANGKPGIHHVEARSFKDAIPRYKTMQGYHVRRKGGWDTHGLPVELQVEKQLGLKSKKEIEQYGIAEFNQKCRESVWEYVDIWDKFTERVGYWVDEKNPYITYKNDYIESVWNVLKKVDNQGLLYKDYKVLPWCPRCGTALSSHELAQGYQNDKDLSVTAKFKVVGQDNTYILAWTTTPWTLPGNVALAVGKDIEYVKIRKENEILILAKERLSVIEGQYEVIETIKGKKLVGLEYEPLYSYLKDQAGDFQKESLAKAYKVYEADFVTTVDGTGVVHTAVMYGQDDFVLGAKIGLPKYHLVDESGNFIKGTGFLEGRFVKDEEVAVDIIKDLAHRGLLFKKEKYEHSYPHCWRCKTALIYYARDSWYIRMSDPKVKAKLIKENESINWEPSHIREGRFGEWLKEIKDWAISRERYWGTPLPIWHCKKCNITNVLGSLEEIKKKTKKSGNAYYIMRHGETDGNVKGLVSTIKSGSVHLTENGKKEVHSSAKTIKDAGIELIITSPFNRAIETANIVALVLGIPKENILEDERLGEMQVKSYEGREWEEYHKDFPKTPEYFNKAKDNDESYEDVKVRSTEFLFDLENKYSNKKILIVTHGAPAWLMTASARGFDISQTIDMIVRIKGYHYLDNAETQRLDFYPYPHNEKFELDFHRPYIDEISLACDSCEEDLVRTKEVMDVWFDSGAMPFAQDHYPFENKDWVDGSGYPADFISEAIDQTRGWFYTLHAVGVLMGRGKAYKNVICLGHLLDKDGKKMSKSLGNVVDPWTMIEKYGVDTLRLWMYGVNQPGESKNFDEKTVAELHNKVFNLLYNVLAFYELYRDKDLEKREYKQGDNILDIWIVARFYELVDLMTKNLDNYKLLEPTRAIRDFVDDLSTWYLRRSRERIKGGDKEAKETLYFILKNLTKLMAPLAPFSAEDIWLKLRNEKDVESVHLSEWLKSKKFDEKIIEEMKKTRETVSVLLKERQKNNLPVRQPVSTATGPSFSSGYEDIIREEVNVKKYITSEVIEINTDITPELKQEGNHNELVRAIQDMRKKMGLMPSDTISLTVRTDKAGEDLINKFKKELLKVVGAREVKFTENNGTEIKIGDLSFVINISK